VRIHTYTQAIPLQTLASDPRPARAQIIAATKSAIKRVNPNLFEVKSQSGVGSYRVTLDEADPSCSCPDAISRGPDDFRARPCKHFLGVRFYLTAERETPHGRIIERIPVTRGQAWSTYNAAQTNEIRLFDILLRDLVNTVQEAEQTIGRPRLPLKDMIFCGVQKVYSQLSSRRARGLFENASERSQLDHIPHFNVSSKLLNREDVTPILHALILQSALPLKGLERTWAIDSTGFRTTSFGAYCAGKYGAVKPHSFLKAHLSVGTRTHIISSAVITESQGIGSADTNHFPKLLQETANAGFVVDEILADKAYSSRANHTAAGDVGAEALIPFKQGARGLALAAPMWKKAYHYFELRRDEFETRYHKRSNIESAIGAIKRKFGETLKSKNHVAQVNELLCKILAYNITVLIHEMHENAIDPSWLTPRAAPLSPPTAEGIPNDTGDGDDAC
jgi:transposase